MNGSIMIHKYICNMYIQRRPDRSRTPGPGTHPHYVQIVISYRMTGAETPNKCSQHGNSSARVGGQYVPYSRASKSSDSFSCISNRTLSIAIVRWCTIDWCVSRIRRSPAPGILRVVPFASLSHRWWHWAVPALSVPTPCISWTVMVMPPLLFSRLAAASYQATEDGKKQQRAYSSREANDERFVVLYP